MLFRSDRARVQTGKISRFGLLELSRQRLRPTLAETSYIPCPRCNGTGHTRSTESSALHILRILEEEAMKENTGALHCQMPVDVATFLLNEKRTDIAKIEIRHHVNLVLIPNIHMETPQHSIVRLRHDQLNQEDTALPSYKMVENPAEEAYTPPSAQTEGRPAAPEAAVKGITPSQPAPIVESRTEPTAAAAATTPAASMGLFARVISWFTGSKPTEPVIAPPPPATEPARSGRNRNERRERGERGGRDDRNEGRRNGRNRQARSENGQNGQNGSRENREPREPRAPRNEANVTNATDVTTTNTSSDKPEAQAKQSRNRGEPRQPRAAKQPATSESHEAVSSGSTVDSNTTMSTAEENGTQTSREGGRRRGRRGGRNEKSRNDETNTPTPQAAPETAATTTTAISSPATQAAAHTAAEVLATVPTAASAVEPSAVAIMSHTPSEETPASTEAAHVNGVNGTIDTPATISTPVPNEMPAPSEIAQTPAAESAPSTTPPVVSTAASETAVESASRVTTPSPAPADPIHVPAAAAIVPTSVNLEATLEQAGLVLIETSSNGAPAYMPAHEAPKLGRKPRQVPVIVNEPLQMVETQPK